MRDISTLKIELGIDAQQIASQVMIDNKNLEKNIAEGIQKCIDEITNEQNFQDWVAVATKSALEKVVKDSINKHTLALALKDAIDKKMKESIDAIAWEWANKFTEKYDIKKP